MQYSDTYCSLGLFDTQLKADSLSLGYLPQWSVLNGEHAEKNRRIGWNTHYLFLTVLYPIDNPFLSVAITSASNLLKIQDFVVVSLNDKINIFYKCL